MDSVLNSAHSLIRRQSRKLKRASCNALAFDNWRTSAPSTTTSGVPVPRPDTQTCWRRDTALSTSTTVKPSASLAHTGLDQEKLILGQIVHLPPFHKVADDSAARVSQPNAAAYDHPFLVLHILEDGLVEGAIMTSCDGNPLATRSFLKPKEKANYFLVEHPENNGRFNHPDNETLHLREGATNLVKPTYVNMNSVLEIEPANLSYQRVDMKDAKDIHLSPASLGKLLSHQNAMEAPLTKRRSEASISSSLDSADLLKLKSWRRTSTCSTSSLSSTSSAGPCSFAKLTSRSSCGSFETTITTPSTSPSSSVCNLS